MKAIFLARARARRLFVLEKMLPNRDQLRSEAQLVTWADSSLAAAADTSGNLWCMCSIRNLRRYSAGASCTLPSSCAPACCCCWLLGCSSVPSWLALTAPLLGAPLCMP
eukprot:1080878-Pelagomonas_calceolata.AAC.1